MTDRFLSLPPRRRLAISVVAGLLLAALPVALDAAENLDASQSPSQAGAPSSAPAPAPVRRIPDASSTAADAWKVGVLDLERVARDSKMVKKMMADTENEMRDLAGAVDAKVLNLKRAQEELDRRRSLISATEVARREEEIKSMRDSLEELQFRARRMARDAEADLIEPILKDILTLAEKYGEANEFDVLLRADVVLAVSPRADITDEVIELLDARLEKKAEADALIDLQKAKNSDGPQSAADRSAPAASTPAGAASSLAPKPVDAPASSNASTGDGKRSSFKRN